MAAAGHLWFSPLLHLLRNHWRNFVEILHMNSSQCLDISARKPFRSINKYGRTAAIFKISICPLLNTVTISLLHLLRDHWSDFFESCLRWFRYWSSCACLKMVPSVDKYGHGQPSLIFPVIASPPKSLEEFCRNLAYEFLSMPRCVHSKTIVVRQQTWPNGSHL